MGSGGVGAGAEAGDLSVGDSTIVTDDPGLMADGADGVGVAPGVDVGAGVALARGVGVAVARGVGVTLGSGVGVIPTGVGVGFGVGVIPTGVAVGFGVGVAPIGVGVVLGEEEPDGAGVPPGLLGTTPPPGEPLPPPPPHAASAIARVAKSHGSVFIFAPYVEAEKSRNGASV